MATQKKKGTSWESVMNQIQGQANRNGQTVTVTFSPRQTTVPRDEQAYTSMQPGARPSGYLAPNQQGPRTRNQAKKTNVVTYQERPTGNPLGAQTPAGFLAPNQQGPRPRPQASTSAPAPARGGGYAFTQAQPALAAAAADKIRNQYAGIQTGSGGAFTTDTNEGLLQLLQAAGITPTPLNQWGQLANRLRR